MSTTYRLLYFNGRGTAERTRLLFALAQQPYEDVRFDQDEFAKAKTDGSLAAGLNRVPLLQVVCEDGTTTNIPQSKAIERFVAKQLGLNGADALAEGVIDGICEHQRDVRESFAKVDTLQAGAEKDTAVQAWLENDLPDWLQKVDAALPGSSSSAKFLCGDSITLADIAWFQFLIEFLDQPAEKLAVTAALNTAPRLKRSVEGVLAQPDIKAWRENRPETW
eukprot:g757.t1